MSRKHIIYPESITLYRAIHEKHPNMANARIAAKYTLSVSTLCKLRKGHGLGVKIAKVFSDEYPEYRYMYEWAKKKNQEVTKRSGQDAVKKRHRVKFKPAMMPSQLRAFVGYAPMRSR